MCPCECGGGICPTPYTNASHQENCRLTRKGRSVETSCVGGKSCEMLWWVVFVEKCRANHVPLTSFDWHKEAVHRWHRCLNLHSRHRGLWVINARLKDIAEALQKHKLFWNAPEANTNTPSSSGMTRRFTWNLMLFISCLPSFQTILSSKMWKCPETHCT